MQSSKPKAGFSIGQNLKAGLLALGMVLVLLWSGCQRHPLSQFLFLSGTWVNEEGGVEIWEYGYADSLKGRGGMLSPTEGDTAWFEELALTYDDRDRVYYVATVKSNPAPVSFELTEVDTALDSWAFENPDHDFPKKIAYRLVNDDSMEVTISGDESAKSFSFSRVTR